MSRAWWVGAVLLLTAASAVLLPKLADLNSVRSADHGVTETFSGKENRVLAEDNLVDLLGSLPLKLSIDRVDWESGILSLDLKVTNNDSEPKDIYRDMARVIGFAFLDTPNVNELLLRIIAEDKWIGSRRLLLAGDIRRLEWSPELLYELDATENTLLSDRLKDGFRITESVLWRNQFTYH